MRIIRLTEPLTYNYHNAGFFSFISREPLLLKLITDRTNIALKVFFTPLIGNIKEYYWGHPFKSFDNTMSIPVLMRTPLDEAIIIQNIAADHDLAPRVYELLGLQWEGKVYPTLVVEDLGIGNSLNTAQERDEIIEKINKLGEKYGFYPEFKDVGQTTNFLAGKFVDFQGWRLKPDYRDRLIKRYKDNAKWSENTYQSLPELGIEGYRDNARRVELMELDKIDFTNKYVVDIGCSGGFYSRYAVDRGAYRVVAIDVPKVARIAREISVYLGYPQIDYSDTELEVNKDYDFGFSPDIIFYLSVYRYFGYAPFIKKARTVIYEHNGDKTLEEVIKEFSADFSNYEIIGVTGATTGSKDNRQTVIFTK